MAEKLTGAQAFALIDLDEYRHNDGWMRNPPAGKPTMRVLRERGYVESRPFGVQHGEHRITPAGRIARAALTPTDTQED